MKKVEAIRKLNETELQLGIAGTPASWHEKYNKCHAIYVGGIPTEFTEGDLLAMFEQYGIVVHVNLVRDADTGKSRGFAFLKYHDPRSAVLAVDNFTGVQLAGRTLRVDHVEDYTVPEDGRPGTLDTTPAHLRHDTSVTQAANFVNTDEIRQGGRGQVETQSADALREKMVLERLRAMRHKTRPEDSGTVQGSMTVSRNRAHTNEGTTDAVNIEGVSFRSGEGDVQPRKVEEDYATAVAQMEKQRRREEKAQRKAERARIREHRRQRREAREKSRSI